MNSEHTPGENNVNNDPNWIEYQRTLNAGELDNYPIDTFFAYCDGQLVGHGSNRDKLVNEIFSRPGHNKESRIMIAQVEQKPTGRIWLTQPPRIQR